MPDWPLRLLGALSGLAMLTGCVGINPTLDMISTMLPGKDPALMVARGHEYVLIEIDGRKTAMALGLRQEVIESGQLRVHEHWYSGQREMIHMVNGRIHTALGLTVEWRRQRSSPPSWAAVSDAKATMPWTRELDVMPGYRFGQVDRIETKPASLRRRPQLWPLAHSGSVTRCAAHNPWVEIGCINNISLCTKGAWFTANSAYLPAFASSSNTWV